MHTLTSPRVTTVNQNANSYKPPYWQYQGTELHRDAGATSS